MCMLKLKPNSVYNWQTSFLIDQSCHLIFYAYDPTRQVSRRLFFSFELKVGAHFVGEFMSFI